MIPRCPCESSSHGPAGCPEESTDHPEDDSLRQPCGDCAPWDSTGYHSANFPRQRPSMTRDEIDSMLADRELMVDEFHGREPDTAY